MRRKTSCARSSASAASLMRRRKYPIRAGRNPRDRASTAPLSIGALSSTCVEISDIDSSAGTAHLTLRQPVCEGNEWKNILEIDVGFPRACVAPRAHVYIVDSTRAGKLRVTLFAHELRHVPGAQPSLAANARAFPTAERLDARPG